MAGSNCDAAVAETMEGFTDGIGQQADAVPHVIVNLAAASGNNEEDDLDPEWVNSIREKLDDEPCKIKASLSSCSIHRIPPLLSHLDKRAYVPQIISIGPFHYTRRRSDLQAMEEHKWRYLRTVIDQNGEDSLKQYLLHIKKLEKQARECYSEEIDLDSNSFVEMMVLDACFIIELFYRNCERSAHVDDPILNLALLPTIRTDLVMLENQIPFFIIQHLFKLINVSGPSFEVMALHFLNCSISLRSMLTYSSMDHPELQFHHLLHFLHLNCLPSFWREDLTSEYMGIIPCASELIEAGIKFRKGVSRGFLSIKYHDGEITIPPIHISQMAESVFLNLVAFEQCYPHQKPYITSYIIFMDSLINSAKDVNVLSQKGIIVGGLGISEDVATLFNKIGREVWMDPKSDYLRDVSQRINRSTESVWPGLRATLMRDYFNSPWAFVSFLAALMLLLLTSMQTFFSAFPKFALKS